MFLQHIHQMSVSRKDQSARHIDPLVYSRNTSAMTNTSSTTLVLGGTGKTGSRVASRLTDLGRPVRTAARHGADVRFDWGDAATHPGAVAGVDRIYLIAPVMRTTFAPQVSAFLDLAEAAGVQHVTYLSAYGIDKAPAEIALRAVELDLIQRETLTHSIVRPAWFMQNFSETFLKPINDAIVVPTGNGGEAFVDAEDIPQASPTSHTAPPRHGPRRPRNDNHHRPRRLRGPRPVLPHHRASTRGASTSPSTTTDRPTQSCSNTRPRAESSQPVPPTPTATSRYSPSTSEKSPDGATTSTRSPSSTLSDGPRNRAGAAGGGRCLPEPEIAARLLVGPVEPERHHDAELGIGRDGAHLLTVERQDQLARVPATEEVQQQAIPTARQPLIRAICPTTLPTDPAAPETTTV
jgi:uncharacterized protein YbjT (DUF2867 family)